MDPRRLPLVALLVVMVLAVACSPGDSGSTSSGGTPVAAPDFGTVADAFRRLEQLEVTPRVHRDDYDRDAFGSDWVDTDGDGCNQRDDVLLRDSVPGTARFVQRGGCDHDVIAGTWLDPYTGQELRFDDLKDPSQAQAIQIDHIVPLGEAWSSGASSWSDRRRVGFANDLAELIAVDGPTNASKGDDDPAAWRPQKSFQCEYAVRWIAAKWRWKLAVDESEKRALREMLGFC